MALNPYRQLINKVNKKKPLSEPARHARRAFRNNKKFSLSITILVITIVFLFLPLFFIGLYSFNGNKGTEFTDFSLVWYKELLCNSEDLWDALLNSLIIAFSSALVSTILGTLAAVGIKWYKFFGKNWNKEISFTQSAYYKKGKKRSFFWKGHFSLSLYCIYALKRVKLG